MLKYLLSKCVAVAVVLIIATALLVSLVRLLLPVVGQYRSDVEAWINQSVGQPVVIGALAAEWRGLGPSLKLTAVHMRDAEQRPVAYFEEVNIDIDVVASLLHGRFEPGHITVTGVNLSIVRRQDGSLVIAGIAGSAEGDNAVMRDWLFSRERISIEKSRVQWRDLQNNSPLKQFRDVSFTFTNQGDRHLLAGKMLLPVEMGRELKFAADFTGNFLNVEAWDGEIYLKGEGLIAKEWLGKADLHGVVVTKGTVDIALWSQWREAQPVDAQGEIRILDLQLGNKTHRGVRRHSQPRFDSVSGRFNWQRTTAAWTVDVDRFVIMRNGLAWLPSHFRLGVSDSENGQALEAGFSFLRIQDITPTLLLGDLIPDNARSALTALQPKGDVADLVFRYSDTVVAKRSFFVQANFTGVSVQPWQHVPGLHGIAGSLQAGQDSGVITIDTERASINVKKLFRDAWPIDKFFGTFEWQRKGPGWRIQSDNSYVKNSDLEGRVNVALDWQQGKPPFLDLIASVRHGKVASISRYLPAHIMPPRVVSWLDDAILDGRVVSGGVLFRGVLSEFPFDAQQGRFEVRAQVEDGVLDYAPGWPKLTRIQAEVVTIGRSLAVIAQKAETLQAKVLETEAVIPDLTAEPAILTVIGSAVGGTDDALRFLTQTPLRKDKGRLFAGAVAQGVAELDLTLVLPLSPAAASVEGVLVLRDSTLNLQDIAQIDAINGTVLFSDQGLSAKSMAAQVFGQKVRADIKSEEANNETVTVLKASGKADVADLVKQFQPSLHDVIKGSANWRATLSVSAPRDNEKNIDLVLESQLQGISVDLPQPFGKSAAQLQKLSVDMSWPLIPQKPLSIRYGENVAGLVSLKQHDKQLVVERGELRFGGAPAHLPVQPGLRIAGQLAHYSTREWDSVIASLETDKKPSPSEPLDHALRWLDVRIDDLEVMGSIFSDMTIRAEKSAEAWIADVASVQAAGKIRLPHNPSQAVSLDFDRLFLKDNKASAGKQSATDPRQLPPLQLKSRQFKFNNINFGALMLTASKISDGLKFSDLSATSPHTRIQASGEWTMVAKQQVTRLQMMMDSDDVGRTLAAFGYADSIRNGTSHSDVAIKWLGPPSAFALKDIDGVLEITIKNGRLLDVDPGAGRIFGLLSLQALPRRLSLDFSDLFAKGFSFDTIIGKFTIENGSALVDSLTMDGPAARVDATGRIGLSKRDYDQEVVVTPHVTSSLPLAIGVLASPAAGAAAWLAEKLISRQVGNIARIKYSVKGPWDNPVVELLSNTKQKKRSEDRNFDEIKE